MVSRLTLLIALQFKLARNTQDQNSCLHDKIEAIQQQPKFNPPATVYRYLFQDKYVYLFSSNCCDQYNYVRQRLQVICAPSGGIAGQGDGRCSNFNQMPPKTLIWKDPR
jgi:hypothetical protein